MTNVRGESPVRIAFVSSYARGKGGIAAFTSDLIANISRCGPKDLAPLVMAVNSGAELEHVESAEYTIRRDTERDYISAADYINARSEIGIVSVQHAFDLYGGQAGSYLSIFLRRLDKPTVTTLHTIIENPPKTHLDSLADVCGLSDAVAVRNKRSVAMLGDIYGVAQHKIALIPQGIHEVPRSAGESCKRELGISGRKMILTCGMLDQNDGIEFVLKAMPAIIKADPSVLYIVLAPTRPDLIRSEGLAHKRRLEAMVADLGISEHVAMLHRSASDEQLRKFLGAADLYVSPYLQKQRLTSYMLALAVGAGKAIVSTPYWAAEELLAHGRGALVGFGDCEQIARSVVGILGSDSLMMTMQTRAYDYGRAMVWPRVGQMYWGLFHKYMGRTSPIT